MLAEAGITSACDRPVGTILSAVLTDDDVVASGAAVVVSEVNDEAGLGMAATIDGFSGAGDEDSRDGCAVVCRGEASTTLSIKSLAEVALLETAASCFSAGSRCATCAGAVTFASLFAVS